MTAICKSGEQISVLKEKLKNKEKITGKHLSLNDVSVARIASISEYDFIWIDIDWNYLSFDLLRQLVTYLKSVGAEVLVRVPYGDLSAIDRVMRMGVDGIVFPAVRTALETDRMLSYTLNPQPFTHSASAASPRELCRFVQLEHADAIRNLEEIMQNEFIDGYIIAEELISTPFGRFGYTVGDYSTALIREIVSRLKSNGKYVGLSTKDTRESTMRYWRDMGIDMLSCGKDYKSN